MRAELDGVHEGMCPAGSWTGRS